MKESITGKNSRLIMEVHSTHTYIGKRLELVYRNTTNQGVPALYTRNPEGEQRPNRPSTPLTLKA
jgi:hypothetical protein